MLPTKKDSSLDILFLLHPYIASLDTGAGHDRYAYELMQNLRKLGQRVGGMDSGHIKTIAQAVPSEILFPLRLIGKKADIFHATASVNARSGVLMGKRPLVTTVHDVIWFHTKNKFDTSLKDVYKRYCIKLGATRSDKVIVPFKSTQDFLINHLKVKPEKIRLVPYGSNTEQFFPDAIHKEGKSLDSGKAALTILFVGALTKAKGVDTLIESFEAVKRALPNAQLVLCSGGWHKDYLNEVWQNSPVKDSIIFKGFVPDSELRQAYASADLTVFPSHYGFGLPMLESMACATPSIGGKTLDATDFVQDNDILVEPGSVSDLATKIVRLLSDPALYAKKSREGLAIASNFSWLSTAEKTLQVYRELLA